MNGIQTSIPQRLQFIRIIVTISLIVSFLMSINLWGGNALFPTTPLFEDFIFKPYYSYILMVLSILFLVCSLINSNIRLFLFLSIVANLVLVILDLNRLQPWFYVYNAILFILMFYDGRVDDSGKFTYIFICIQTVIASVYVFNGINQINDYFLSSDFYQTIEPLKNIFSERQFNFFMNLGKFVPYFIIFLGIGLLIRPVRYLSISAAWVFHLLLLILLFPSSKNSNYALWFMNLSFAFIILFLFSGKTKQRYFSLSLLFQKPVFYMAIFAFWLVPLLNYFNYWPQSPTSNFKYGVTNDKNLAIDESTFNQLPLYVRYFCEKNEKNYSLKISEWCNYELKSECITKVPINHILKMNGNSLTQGVVKESEDKLSSL